MRTERVLSAATVTLTVCAVIVTGLLVRREVLPPAVPAGTPRTKLQNDWQRYATTGHGLGPADAKVTIVEFADFECPYCRRFSQYVDSLRSLGQNVRVVYRHYPLHIHRFAIPAARASECAADQGRFNRMHDVLFGNPDSLGLQPWAWFAKKSGVPDSALFAECMARKGSIEALARDTVDGNRLGVTGTPTLLIGQVRVDGVPSFDSLSAYVARANMQKVSKQ